jgi:hypothetical protein
MDPETDNQRAEHVPDLLSLCRSMFEGSSLPMAMLAGAKRIVRYRFSERRVRPLSHLIVRQQTWQKIKNSAVVAAGL